MFRGTAQVSHQICHFFVVVVSSVCLLVRVTVVDKHKAVVCRLLATSAIILSEKKKRKRKMCSKKWYFENKYITRCSSAELLETDVHWDDAIAVWASKLRKLWDSLSELYSSLCQRRLERTVLRPAVLIVKTAQFIQFFPLQVWCHILKSLSLPGSV